MVDATGAAGGRGGGTNGGQGGLGGEVTGTVSVAPGQSLDVCVGVGGGPGAGTGGGGGGASGVSPSSNFINPVLIAAGGGGGGAAGSLAGGAGGSAGSSGSPASGGASGGSVGGGSAPNAAGPGPGAAGTGTGGGGGGAGGPGGGGGTGNSLGSGGGAGGTSYCIASGCTTAVAAGGAHVTLTYTVVSGSGGGTGSPPSVSIAVPVSGGVYNLDQVVDSNFSCVEGAGGPGISSCADQSGQPSGAAIDTSTPGTHTFTVTAQSGDGLSTSSSTSYTVAAPPRIWVPLPGSGEVFTVGQVVSSWFLCGEGDGGPGLKSCADQNGQPSGALIDTSKLGSRTFTVTAVSQDGQTSSVTHTYRVIPPPTISHVVVHRGGLVTLSVTVYGPGTVDVLSTAGLRAFALAADVVHPPNGSFVFGSAHIVASRQRTYRVQVQLSPAGKLLLVDHRRATLRLLVVYTPPGGLPDLVKSLVLSVTR